MRALVVVRLSRVTEATTSPERQLEICQQFCTQRGYDIVGVAQDLDVSGAVDPFDKRKRPNLSRWLSNEELDDHGNPVPFDVIVAYRVDRLTRSIRNLQDLVNWATDNGKLVVSATEAHFDMSSPFAAVLIALIGTVVEMELEAITERNRSTARFNLKAGKYRGSTPPWGYMPKRDDKGDWRLVPDDYQVKVIHEVVARALTGEPLQPIARDLTARGVLTVKDRIAQLQGKPVKGTEWSAGSIKRSLLSEAMLGYAVSDGKAVRNDDGSPVVRSAPIIKREDFDRLKVELAGRSQRGEPTTRTSSLLLRVLYCGVCGDPYYRFNGGSHSQFARYRCRSIQRSRSCGNATLRLDSADNDFETLLLGLLGASERMEKVWQAGSDNSAELSEINDELTDLTSLIATPAFRAGTPQRVRLDERIAELAARQQVLESEEIKPSGWTLEPTGERFSDWWESQDIPARNVWLRSNNVRVDYSRGKWAYDFGDLGSLLSDLNAKGAANSIRDLFRDMREGSVRGVTITSEGVELAEA